MKMRTGQVEAADQTASGNPARHAGSVTLVSILAGLGLALGFARDAGLASIFGASSQTDAFFVATLIPAMVGTVVIGGALGPAMLPLFAGGSEDRAGTFRLANFVLTFSGLFLVGIVLLVAVESTTLVQILAPGFEPARADQTTRLAVLAAPSIGFLGLSALLGSLLNALDHFIVPALGTALVNASSVLGLLLLAGLWGVDGVVAGMVAGAVIQFGANVWALHSLGWTYRPVWHIEREGVAKIARLFLPLLAFVALAQVVPLVERILSSEYAAGQLSCLALASKLYQIPGLLFSSSVAIVLYPALARESTLTQVWSYARTLNAGFRNVLFLTVPVALWMFFASVTWVKVLFERGQYSANDTRLTAELLQWYSLAIVPAAGLLVLTRGFFAQRDMLTPLGIGILNTAIYVTAAIVLTRYLAVVGLPLAFFVSQLTGLLITGGALTRRLGVPYGKIIGPETKFIGFAALSVLAVAVLWYGLEGWAARLPWGLHTSLFGIGLGLSGVAYFLVAHRLHVVEASHYVSLLQTLVTGLRERGMSNDADGRDRAE